MIEGHDLDGFTLIELLIVIAILGVLAVVILIVLNPTEKQAQARDTGRISSIAQVGRSMQAYYTQQGNYPSTGTWAQDLLDYGELSSFPSGIDYSAYSTTNCTSFVQPAIDPTYCYNLDSDNGALVFARAEANSHNEKCTAPEVAYFVFSTSDSRGGTICSSGDPSPWASGSGVYVE
jgi:prepilin-type N-terminal cleavage/methylation domain-containing protein